MATKQTMIFGAIIITLMATGVIYMQLSGQAQIKLDKASTTFQLMQNGKWITAGIEYNSLWYMNKKINVSSVTTSSSIANGIFSGIRTTNYVNGAKIVDTYKIQLDNTNIEMFPADHKIVIDNCQGCVYRYEVKRLIDGKVHTLDGQETSATFGRNMKVTWWPGYANGKITATTVTVNSKSLSNGTAIFNVRLFDPPNWATDNSLIVGIRDIAPDDSHDRSYVFYRDSDWWLAVNDYYGRWQGYRWNSTGWEQNWTPVLGLSNVSAEGQFITFSVFYKDSTWYLVGGRKGGYYVLTDGYAWNGTSWVTNAAIIAGTTGIGPHISPDVFELGGQWYMIINDYSATRGYVYNVNTWVVNSTILGTTLPNAGGGWTSAGIKSYSYGGELWMVIENTYMWNGTNWAINASMNGPGGSASYYTKDSRMNAISPSWTGYYLNESSVIVTQSNYTNDRLTYTMSGTFNKDGACTLWGNWSGSWAMNETKSVTANTAFNFTSITFDNSGNYYYWGINCSDSSTEIWGSNISFNTIDSLPPTCELVSRYPLEINDSSSGYFNVLIRCSDKWGINTTQGEGGHYRAFTTRSLDALFTLGVPNYWSFRYPNNSMATVFNAYPQYGGILRAFGRNRGFWYDSLNYYTTFNNDTFSYAANDGHYGRVKLQNITDSSATINYTGIVDMAFRQNFYLSYESQVAEQKKNLSIYNNNYVVYKRLDNEALRNNKNYTMNFFRNIGYIGNPTKNLNGYVCNFSFNIKGNLAPSVSPFCTLFTSLSAAQLSAQPIAFSDGNSSYTRATFGINNGIIGGLTATAEYYIAYESQTNALNAYYIRYMDGPTITGESFSQTNVTWRTTNGGSTWTPLAITPDSFTTSVKRTNDVFEFGSYIEDNNGNGYMNLTVFQDEISTTDWDISFPYIHHYSSSSFVGEDLILNGSHYGMMDIGVIPGKDPDGPGLVNNSLYLIYPENNTVAYVINSTIISPDDMEINVIFNTSLVNPGIYKMNVTSTSLGRPSDIESFLTAFNFTILSNQNQGTNFTSYNGSTYRDVNVFGFSFRCSSTQKNCEPRYQSSLFPVFKIGNNGTELGNKLYFYMNETCENITMFCGVNYTIAQASIITSTPVDLDGGILDPDMFRGVYCWANYSSPTKGCDFDIYTNVTLE